MKKDSTTDGAPKLQNAKPKTGLQRAVELGELLVKKQTALAAAEAEVAALSKELLKLKRDDLPALMDELELTEFVLKSGARIRVKPGVSASITEQNKPQAFAWLITNGFGGIIKTLVEVQFGKGEHDAAEKAAALLKTRFKDREVSVDESVHSSTLNAFVKERMEKGEGVPLDLFGVFTYKEAVATD
jgi:hypothetical protein